MIAIALSFMAACTESKGTEKEPVTYNKQNLPDSLLAILRHGDLALRKGRDVVSYMISRTGVEDKTYSHCGLVQIENGQAVVYHFISGADKARWGLVRDAAAQFFSVEQNSIAGVKRYALNEAQIQRQTELIKQYYGKRNGFDMDFNMRDADKLYCSEFIYYIMNDVMQDSSFIQPATKNGFSYVSIDQLYRNDRAADVWQMHFK